MKKFVRSMMMVVLVSGMAGCATQKDTSTDTEEEENQVVTVEVAEAKEDSLRVVQTVLGRTAPNTVAPIVVQSPGKVDGLEVENGDSVEEGDLIAKLSTPTGTQNVRAIRDGEIINLQVREGDMANTEEPIAMIADLDEVEIQFSVTADNHSLLSKDDTLPVVVDGNEYEATVIQKDTLPDDTGLYPVVAKMKNPDEGLLPGRIAEIHIPEEKIDAAIIVPTTAIVEEDGEAFVYVVKDDIATKQVVTILETQSEETAIEGGVEEGAQVIVSGHLTLTDGRQVDVTEGNKS
ncbi:efflux RND transporter periplasmic adaptor subunit [Oceanobacillus senegalensis]|uniref:efflux RND transporter periplasmic adaptor subunit n=1 Tax=Oceanobacillus senegalensis TaxID=1936063 RepID=UPI0015C4127C|nr:efflux RND transporter periplasmic adaptor subunit [Oceanobacillus senegalensis]